MGGVGREGLEWTQKEKFCESSLLAILQSWKNRKGFLSVCLGSPSFQAGVSDHLILKARGAVAVTELISIVGSIHLCTISQITDVMQSPKL